MVVPSNFRLTVESCGREPDIDGSCSRNGFIVQYSGFSRWSYRFCTVQICWSEYHK